MHAPAGVDHVEGQDIAPWVTQGAITDRTVEHLGRSDVGEKNKFDSGGSFAIDFIEQGSSRADGGQGLTTEYWVGADRVFACFCGACGWSGDMVLADRVTGHEPAAE